MPILKTTFLDSFCSLCCLVPSPSSSSSFHPRLLPPLPLFSDIPSSYPYSGDLSLLPVLYRLPRTLVTLPSRARPTFPAAQLTVSPEFQLFKFNESRVWSTHSLVCFQIRSDQISHSVVSDSLRPHESQHARPPCPSPTPGVHSDSCPSSQ